MLEEKRILREIGRISGVAKGLKAKKKLHSETCAMDPAKKGKCGKG